MVLYLRILGRFELALGPGGGTLTQGWRAQLLLAWLALGKGERLDRGVLAAHLWGDRAESQARASLRQAIFSLRQSLKAEAGAIRCDGETVQLDPMAVDCDATIFERLASSLALADLENALTLYRGDLLEGADLTRHDTEGFFHNHRQRLRDCALQVAMALASGHAKGGHWEDAVRVARRGLVLDPYAEPLNTGLVRALQAQGRHREARDQDEGFRRRMKSELGLALPLPGPAGIALPPLSPRPLPSPLPDHSAALVRAPRNLMPPLAGSSVLLALVALVPIVLALAAGFGFWQIKDPPARGPDVSQTAVSPVTNLQAYDLFLRAEALRIAADDQTGLRAAIDLFGKAIALDPGFSDAHAGLAMTAVTLAQHRFEALLPADDSLALAYRAAGAALQTDPENAHALIVLSRLQAQDGASDMALISAKRAVLARPADGEARGNLALLLSRSGESFLARTELTRMRQIAPMPRPADMVIYGEIAFAEGRYSAAIADLVAAWPDLPHSQVLLTHLSAALAIHGQLAEARKVQTYLRAALPEASLHRLFTHYAPLRSAGQNQRLLEGLRRAGLAVWSQGVDLSPADRLDGAQIVALVGHVPGSPDQYLRGEDLCRIESGRSVCGGIYKAPTGRGVDYVFVAPNEIRFFSDPPK